MAMPLSLHGAATAPTAREMRQAFQAWLRRLDATVEVVEDLGLVVYEALANAVEHAYHPGRRHRPLRLDALVDCETVVVTVSDEGRWRPEHEPGHRGRGLELMRHLAEVHVAGTTSGTTIVLRAPLERKSAG